MGWQDDPLIEDGWESDPVIDDEAPFAGAKAGSVADPKIGQPEELAWYEKVASSLPDSWGAANVRGSWAGRLAKGMADPGAAVVQIGANLLPGGAGKAVNDAIAGREREYQEARKAAGSDGFDPLRATGQALITAPLFPAGAGVLRGAAAGAVAGATDPVRNAPENFWGEKAEQAAIGAAGGAVLSPIFGALSRIISPKASTDQGLKMLREEGINPTVGQASGGWLNAMEQKATSIPVMGDMISRARRGAIEDFNEAAINRAVKPVGGSVRGSGTEAVKEAGDQLSDAYQRALGQVSHVNFSTPDFAGKLSELEQLATGLKPDLQPMFTKIIDNVIGTKMSPNGSILGQDLKAVDSALGKLAAKYRGAGDPFTRELGDAVLQLKTIVMDQVRDSAPEVAKQLGAADKGWAWLTRLETASKKAVNQDGVFTPGQWNQAVREGDRSVRKRATARGEALGQDLGAEAQRVLGNTYPDSGSIGRLANVGLLASMAAHPGPALAAAGGAALYSRPVQNALVRLMADRPEYAPVVANYLRRLQVPATAGGMPLLQEME